MSVLAFLAGLDAAQRIILAAIWVLLGVETLVAVRMWPARHRAADEPDDDARDTDPGGEHEGATEDWSPADDVDAVGPGRLRPSGMAVEDLADLQVAADHFRIERAARAVDVTGDLAAALDHFDARIFDALARFRAVTDPIAARLYAADPVARYRDIVAADRTGEWPIVAARQRRPVLHGVR